MVKSSFVSIAEQIVTLNQNNVEILAGLEQAVSSDQSTIEIKVVNSEGVTEVVNMPTVGYLQAEINRLNRNINTLAGFQGNAYIQTDQDQFQKILVADLNREPNPISELNAIQNFVAQKNWFFDTLLNPILAVELDLQDKIENNVGSVLSRRYIINFNQDANGNYTDQALTAINLFNEEFKNRTNITTTELENWILNTPGIKPNPAGSKIEYDEQIFNLDANNLQYDGIFTVLGVDEDVRNRKMWYLLDTLDYYDVVTRERRNLTIGDELIANLDFSTTRFEIAEISTAADQIRVNLRTVQGYDPVPVGITGGLKFYSEVQQHRTVKISVGFDEYNVIFIKPINTDNNLLARDWSAGVAFYTNDLRLRSNSGLGQNGLGMTEFYINQVQDYGRILQDLVLKRIPDQDGIQPDPPVLTPENFTVIQANKNITDNADKETLRNLNTQANNLRSQLDQLNKTLIDKREELAQRNFVNPADRTKLDNEIKKLATRSENVAQQLGSVVNQITSQEQLTPDNEARFSVRGFWSIPAPKTDGSTKPQEVIQFWVQYRYLSNSGQENQIESFKVTNAEGEVVNANLSNWHNYFSDLRRRVYDVDSQTYVWQQEDLTNPDQVNINQLDIPLEPNSQVEIRVKSISEVGWPENRLESNWSDSIIIQFPAELIPQISQQDRIRREAELENVRLTVISDLNARGLDAHLSGSFSTANDRFYAHEASQIAVQQGTQFLSLDEKLRIIENNENVQRPQQLELENGWINYGSGFGTAQFYKHESRVYLEGMIRVENVAAGRDYETRYPDLLVRSEEPTQNQQYTNIAILPVGFRPETRKTFMVPCSLPDPENPGIASYPWGNNETNNLGVMYGRVDILPNGIVRMWSGATGWLSLDQINFRVPIDTQTQITNEDNATILATNTL